MSTPYHLRSASQRTATIAREVKDLALPEAEKLAVSTIVEYLETANFEFAGTIASTFRERSSSSHLVNQFVALLNFYKKKGMRELDVISSFMESPEPLDIHFFIFAADIFLQNDRNTQARKAITAILGSGFELTYGQCKRLGDSCAKYGFPKERESIYRHFTEKSGIRVREFDEFLRVREACQPTATPAVVPMPAEIPAAKIAAPDPSVSIVLPVYRDLAATARAIASVLESRNATPYELIVISDAPPEQELRDYLHTLEQRGLLRLVENQSNLGFVKSINLAIGLASGRDIVILTSDTEVYGNWLDRLRHACYCRADIASATPLSNSGTLVGYPLPGDFPAPASDLARDIDRVAETVNYAGYVEAPFFANFCVYLKRTCLDEVGTFDETLFPRGYGEDIEFSFRSAALGWKHVIAGNVFVKHLGARSFGQEKEQLIAAGTARILELFPSLKKVLDGYKQSDPLQPLRRNIELGLFALRSDDRPIALFLADATSQSLLEETRHTRENSLPCLVLRPNYPSDSSYYIESTAEHTFYNLGNFDPRLRNQLQALENVLAGLNVKCIRIPATDAVPHQLLDMLEGLIQKNGLPPSSRPVSDSLAEWSRGAPSGAPFKSLPDFWSSRLAQAFRQSSDGGQKDSSPPLPTEIRAIAFYGGADPGASFPPDLETWEQIDPYKAGIHFDVVADLPAQFGFFTEVDRDSLARDITIAGAHGLTAFCYRQAVAGGSTRTLNPGLSTHLANSDLDFEFCIELQFADQNFKLDSELVETLRKTMADPRHCRHEGKPILVVHFAALDTAKAWQGFTQQNPALLADMHLIVAGELPDDATFDNAGGLLQAIQNVGELFACQADGRPGTIRQPIVDHSLAPPPGQAIDLIDVPGDETFALQVLVAAEAFRRQGGNGKPYVFIDSWNDWRRGSAISPAILAGKRYLGALKCLQGIYSLPPEKRGALGLGFTNPIRNFLPPHLGQALSAAELEKHAAALRAPSAETVHFIVVDDHDELNLATASTVLSCLQQLGACKTSIVSRHAQPYPFSAGVAAQATGPDLVHGIDEVIASTEADWLIFLSAGDKLVPHASLLISHLAGSNPEAVFIYSDELIAEDMTRRSWLNFKPDFNATLLRHQPYLGGLYCVRRSAYRESGGFERQAFGHHEFDLALRLTETYAPGRFIHLPEILTWRVLPGRPGQSLPAEQLAGIGQAAIQRHLARKGIAGQVDGGLAPGCYSINYKLPSQPLVSIIVPTRDHVTQLQRCIETIISTTSYPNYEILVVNNDSQTTEATTFLSGLNIIAPGKIRVLDVPGEFNFAAINNFAAKHAQGELLLLLNNDTAVLHDDWLERMVGEIQQPGIGIVSGRLIFPNGTVQHAGIILGLRGAAESPWIGDPYQRVGYHGRTHVEQELSAVSGACLMIWRQLYRDLGGMNEQDFRVAYGDVDLCLRARAAGSRIVWTPHVSLLHEGGKTLKDAFHDRKKLAREKERFKHEQDALLKKWHKELANDPAYNQNLSLISNGFEPESRPELGGVPLLRKNDLHVLALHADAHGSGHYRIIDPAKQSNDQSLAFCSINGGYPLPLIMERMRIDTLFTQRQLLDKQLDAIKHIKHLLGTRIVLDFDDLLTAVPMKSVHRASLIKDVRPRMRKALNLADRVTASTEPLAEHLRLLHPDVRVVPNALYAPLWENLKSQRRRGRKPRVGWIGGVSHTGDLEVVADVIRQLADEVEWVFMGMCLDEVRAAVTEFHTGVPFMDYPAKMAQLDLDLAIAPLEINAFNECKSNLRLLEYGALGYPVIATDFTPYQCDFPVTLVKNKTSAWIKAIRDHIYDLDEAEKRGDALRTLVREQCMLSATVDRWVEAWRI